MGECEASVIFDESLTQYNFGPTHPMAPIRVDLTMQLADQIGVLDNLRVIAAPHATKQQLLTVHTPELIAAVTKCGTTPGYQDLAHGLGSDDDPVFADMHTAAAHVVGATIEAARQVYSGESRHSVSVAGGLHHAMPNAASGFCIYNDVAAAIQWLLDQGVPRIAYIDVDVHHGDGVQQIFYNDPRVLTISLHETGQLLFPGTGFPYESGGPDAPGTAVNVALPPGTADSGWLRAFHAVVPPLVREFDPWLVVSQQGCDSHQEDPLAHLMLSVDGQRSSYEAIHALAHEVCEGRWLATGGGGYAIVEVVPRAWSHLLAIASGHPVDPGLAVPDRWRERALGLIGVEAPLRMTDGRTPTWRGWESGYDPDTWLDRAIKATRDAVFPLHGLDPEP